MHAKQGNRRKLFVNELGYGNVREQHELLDEPVAVLDLVFVEVHWCSIFVVVEFERDLRLINSERAIFSPFASQRYRDFLQLQNHILDILDRETVIDLRKVARFSFNYALRVIVTKLLENLLN